MTLKGKYSIGLILINTCIIGLSSWGTSSATVQPQSTDSSKIAQNLILLDWFRRERDYPGEGSSGISRGPICAISIQEDNVIWNTTPLLVWQGNLFPKIAIREDGEPLPLWMETATDNETGIWRLTFPETPLQPGTQYELLFYLMHISDPDSPTQLVRFQVMDGEERERISSGLEDLETELDSEGASEEEVALAKAEYFLEAELPADALQAIFAVSEPSEELLATQEALIQEICIPDSDNS
jgi:hypothetical protein